MFQWRETLSLINGEIKCKSNFFTENGGSNMEERLESGSGGVISGACRISDMAVAKRGVK